MHDNGNNIFDEDNALDYIMSEECEKNVRQQKNGKGGCLGIVVLLLIPVASVVFVTL